MIAIKHAIGMSSLRMILEILNTILRPLGIGLIASALGSRYPSILTIPFFWTQSLGIFPLHIAEGTIGQNVQTWKAQPQYCRKWK